MCCFLAMWMMGESGASAAAAVADDGDRPTARASPRLSPPTPLFVTEWHRAAAAPPLPLSTLPSQLNIEPSSTSNQQTVRLSLSGLCSSVVCPVKMAVPTLMPGADDSAGRIKWSGVASSSVDEYSLQRADLTDSLSPFREVYRGPSTSASVSLQSATNAPAAALFLYRVKLVSTSHMDACCPPAWSEPLIVPAPMPVALLLPTSTRGLAVAPSNSTAVPDSVASQSEQSNRMLEWVVVPCVILGSMVVLMVSGVLYRWHRERRRARVNKALVEATNATTASIAVQQSLGRPPAIHIEVCPLPDIVVMSTHARPYALSHSIYSDGRTASVGEGVVAAHPLNDSFF